MASKPKDWTGQRFGKLTAIRNTFEKDVTGNYLWEYRCDCGNVKVLKSGNVVSGGISSCGCSHREKATTHGHTIGRKRSSTYKTWISMMARVKWNSNYDEYAKYYSDVTVCEEWSNRFTGFETFLKDMGERPEGTTLNRKHGAKEYNKDNCEWATPTQQSYDRRKLKKNVSGRTGVKFRQDRGKWEARIGVEGQKLLLYYGDSFEEACAAREEAELKYYGFTKE